MSVVFRQCRLTRSRGRAVEQYTTWLPEPFASAGAVVRLRDDEGDWGDPWLVSTVGPATLSEESMRRAERAHIRARRATERPRAGRSTVADGA